MDRRLLWRGGLLLLLLLAFAIRISGLTAQSLWRDEVDALRFAQAPFGTLFTNFSRPGWNGPLFYVFLRFWIALAGSTEFAMRYFSLCFGVLGVALIYRLGRTWHSPLIGGLAALLYACSPYMVWYAQEAKMYALVCALVVGTLYLYHRALWGGDGRLWIAVVLLTWITVGVHIMGGLLVPVMVVLFFVWWPVARTRWRPALMLLAGNALLGAAGLPWVLPLLIRGGNIGHRFASLPEMAWTMLYAFGRGIASAGGAWPIGLSLFALLAGSVLRAGGTLFARRQAAPAPGEPLSRRTFVRAAWVWFGVPLLGLYAISLRVPMFLDRYLIWIGPAFYLLVARGLDQVRRRSALLAGLCLAGILVFDGWGVVEAVETPIKSDFRAAAAYVQQHRQPGELIMFHISYVRATFEYYYGDASPAADGIATDDRTTEADVDATMRERVAGYNVVWLVLSEPEMWDQRGMTVAWLEAHATPDMRADFARVSVVRYRVAPGAPHASS
jgi:mannosyltransferase